MAELIYERLSETVLRGLEINRDLAEVITINKRRNKMEEHVDYYQVLRNFKQWVVIRSEFNQRHPEFLPRYFICPAHKNGMISLPFDRRCHYFYNLKTKQCYEFDSSGNIKKIDDIPEDVTEKIEKYK